MSIQILPLTLTFSGRILLQLRSAPFFCPGISNRSNQKTSIQKIIKSVRALTRRSMDIVEVATVSPPRRLNRGLAASRQSIDLVLQDPARAWTRPRDAVRHPVTTVKRCGMCGRRRAEGVHSPFGALVARDIRAVPFRDRVAGRKWSAAAAAENLALCRK